MKRKLFVVLGGLALAGILSGCYALREFDWNKDKVRPGRTATADVGFLGFNPGLISEFRFFIIVPEGNGITYKSLKFDTQKKLGNTRTLLRDDSLAAIADDLVSCQPDAAPIARRGEEEVGIAYRTQTEVPVSEKFVRGSIRVKANQADVAGGIGGSYITGLWSDDGDGVPEDPDQGDDGMGCFGMTTSFLLKKGG